jgi:hypothetical protein
MTLRVLSLLCCLVVAGLGWRASTITGAMPADCCCVAAGDCPQDGGAAPLRSAPHCSCAPAPLPTPERTAVPHGALHDFLVLLSLRLPVADEPAQPVRVACVLSDAGLPALVAATCERMAAPAAPLFIRYCSYLT